MIFLWAILLITLNAVWLALVLIGLPGNWLMVLTTMLFAWWVNAGAPAPTARLDVDGNVVTVSLPVAHRPMFAVGTLIAIVAIAAAAEVFEFLAGMAGAQKAGGTWRGSVGALVGGLIGGVLGTFIIPIPLFGSLLGACGGAAAGAWALELSGGRSQDEAVRSGVGAGVGRFFGTVAKFAAGVVIWLVIAVAAFWP